MSTRSIIVTTDKTQSLRLYKHHDGYPSGTLAVIATVLAQAQSSLTANVLAEKLEVYPAQNPNLGVGAIRIEETAKGEFSLSILGDQWDLEWIYVINTTKRTIDVYGGRYMDCSPQDMYMQGMAECGDLDDSILQSLQASKYQLNNLGEQDD